MKRSRRGTNPSGDRYVRLNPRASAAAVGRNRSASNTFTLRDSCAASNYVDSTAAVIAILCVAYFAQGMSALAWMIVSDIAPKGLLGLSGGLFNPFANAAGIVTPFMIGLIVNATGSFVYAMVFISGVTLVGALSYIFVVGDIRRIELKDVIV